MADKVQRQEITQSNLPDYAKPYYTTLMGQAQGLLSQPYTPYQDAQGNPIERIAGFTPQQQQVRSDILNMQGPSQFGTATDLASAAGQASMTAGQYTPGTFNADQVSINPLNYYQMAGPQQFGSEQAQQYMSPYVQNVLDIQKREALRDAQQSQLMQNLGAARQGTYGGSRQLIAGLQRERALGQQLGDIQATGMQSAFQNAQQQFNTEQALRQQAGAQNLQAALGVQELGTNAGLQALLANQQYGLEAQRLGEQSRQFGAQQGLAGLAQAGQMAQTLGNLGQMQGQLDLSRLGMQQQTAAQAQALQQQKYDLDYQDFTRQRDYPLEMLQQYSSLLRGVPVDSSFTTTTSGPGVNPLSYLMAGIGNLGANAIMG